MWFTDLFRSIARSILPEASNRFTNSFTWALEACTRTFGGLSTAGSTGSARDTGSQKTSLCRFGSKGVGSKDGGADGKESLSVSIAFATTGCAPTIRPITSPAARDVPEALEATPLFWLMYPSSTISRAWSSKTEINSSKLSTLAAPLPVSEAPTTPTLRTSATCSSTRRTIFHCASLSHANLDKAAAPCFFLKSSG